ncbi:signal peptidase I [Candidatus Epulonipiscium fishelsonii]|uniref:Signal peptidase I n=1 Tax=Candidatus Epulonipiscium fishelsonii TaxID=77094 RepID=A0ACC8XGH3_9FIRM|nr:signal peptidase I [Epulopiscium sp. SCG-B05WGA-EpuloA1]ONI42750.1 signal peptidase I [Epulopiscium sp. SCG-B11WGA-EpuloA1]ONI47717.1 signal peptidase I [Epulopiscium sp. SCG-C06WGA-EpuloA1]
MQKKSKWIKNVFIIFSLYFLCINFVVQLFVIKGNSMNPTLKDKDLVFINKIHYEIFDPKVGDIVGVKTNHNGEIVKRIIAVGGDTVIYKDGKILVNGKEVTNHNNQFIRDRGDIDYPFLVPENSYFILGDNINESVDSRYQRIGCIEEINMIGRIISF